ncbi:MAG: hypothetical protein LQ350_001229 [Teloschistes chrysophthalmus]|nr:MAG: hypothetical protein LQ350_001229 [Niorma chrysophthalma]
MSALEYRAFQLHRQRRPPPEQQLALPLRSQVWYLIVRASAQVAKLQTYILTGKAFYKVKDGDQCGSIVSSYGTFSLADFYTWNPAVGTNCGSLLYHQYLHDNCTHWPIPNAIWHNKLLSDPHIDWDRNLRLTIPLGTPTTRSTTSTTKTTSPASGPTPTQSGIISSCTKYYKAVSGDSCQVISDKFGTFTVAQFEAWNPAVKSDCSQLYLDYYYCIAIPGTPTTRSTTSTTKTTSKTPTPTPKGPQPQQPGIVSNCSKYYLVKSGDSCYTIEQAQKVTAANFQKWNTGIKADCSNLFVGYYVCIGVL